jgi:hypothetical protein
MTALLLTVQLVLLSPGGLRTDRYPGAPCVLVAQNKIVRVYATRLFHVYDPNRHAHMDLPDDSRVIHTRLSVIVIPPGQGPRFFSNKAVITHPAGDVQYSFGYRGEQPPCPSKSKYLYRRVSMLTIGLVTNPEPGHSNRRIAQATAVV